jgi:hypothetical protein
MRGQTALRSFQKIARDIKADYAVAQFDEPLSLDTRAATDIHR